MTKFSNPPTHPDGWLACCSSSDLFIRAQKLHAVGRDHSTVHLGPGLCRRSLLFGYLQPCVTAAASGMIITVGWSSVRGFVRPNSGWGTADLIIYRATQPSWGLFALYTHIHSASIQYQLVDLLQAPLCSTNRARLVAARLSHQHNCVIINYE